VTPATSLAFLVFALLAGHTMASMAMTLVPSIAPAMARDYDLDPSLVGYQISCASLGQMTTLMFLGNLSRKIGAGRAYQAGLAVIAAGMIMMALPSRLLLVAASLLIGIGHGLLSPSSSALLMRFAPPASRNLLFSVQQTGVPFGGILAALIGPPIAVTVGWPWALAVNALLLVIMVAMLQRGRAQWDTDRDPAAPALSSNPFEGVVRIWQHRPLRYISLTGGFCCWGQFVVISYTVVAAVTEFGMSLVVAGTVLTGVHLGSAGSRVGAGWIADRAGGARVLVWINWLLLGSAALAVGMRPEWPLAAIYALFALLGIMTGAWAGLFLAETARLAPHGQVGATMSGVMIYVNGGKFLGPIIFANIYAVTHSYAWSFGSLAVPALAALYCMAQVDRHATQPAEAAQR